MSNKIDEKLPIAPTINALEVGLSAIFPSERTNAVRSTANLQGLTQHKVFTLRVGPALVDNDSYMCHNDSVVTGWTAPGSTIFDTNIALICVKLRRFAPFLPVFFEPFQRSPPHR